MPDPPKAGLIFYRVRCSCGWRTRRRWNVRAAYTEARQHAEGENERGSEGDRAGGVDI